MRRIALLLAVTLAGCQSLAPSIRAVAPAAVQAKLGAPVGGIAQVRGHTAAQDETELPRVGPPVVPAPPEVREIDLCGALERAGVENPMIALADEAVRASDAVLLQARALLLPTLTGGMNGRVHQGTLLSSLGVVRQVNLQSFYVGAGASAKAAETVAIPGIRIYAQLADAYCAPQAAEQQTIARRFDSVTIRNRTLLDVGTAYLELTAAQATLQALQRSEEDVSTIVRMTANFASTGEGRESDAQRARAVWLLLERQAEEAQGAIATAAAELAGLLDVDPSVHLVSADAVPPLLDIVDPAAPLAQLLQTALANHPELGARSADVATAQIHERQQHVRPWLPLLSMGFSAGGMGGAGNQSGGQPWTAGGRLDVDIIAAWSLQNLGVGNRALQNQARADVGIAESERLRAVNRVREELVSANTLVLARRREVEIARRRTATAQKAFEEDLRRARNIEGRPIELIRSVELLIAARVDLIRAMTGYSQAQLRLYVSLGRTPTCAH
jgi:outer membrane protein TolC